MRLSYAGKRQARFGKGDRRKAVAFFHSVGKLPGFAVTTRHRATDADVDRIVQKQIGKGKTHETNQSYWVSLSQGNDEQLVMAWHDSTYRNYQWIRIRWHRESTCVLQIANDSMSRWRNLSFGDSQQLNYLVGNNKYVLKVENPSADGGWDKNDIIYSFNVYDR